MNHRRLAFSCLLLVAVGCGRAENSLLLIEDLPEVASVTIQGNRAFDDDTLKGLMLVTAGSWWNPFGEHRFRPGQLTTDLNALLTFYLRHGYLRARVLESQVRQSGDKVHITIKLSEGEPISVAEVVILGAEVLDPAALRKKLAVRPGEPLDPFALQDDRRLILRTLAERGYWEARAEATVQFFGNRGLVFYRVWENDPVRVREVTLDGLKEVAPRVARKEISVREGELLTLDQLNKSQIRLIQSGIFADAQWDTTKVDTVEDQVSVRFTMRERKLKWIEAGVGLSSQELIRLTAEWGTRNFLNTGMRFWINSRTDLDFTDRISTLLDEHRTEMNLNRRHLLGTAWEGQPTLFYLYDRENIESVDAEYEQSTVGLGVSVRRRFGDLRNHIILGVENRWVDNQAEPAARDADPQLFRESYQTRLISGWVERDTRNAFFDPTRGSYQNVLAQFAGGALGGNNGFLKGTIGNIRFRGLPFGSGVLATRVQIGYIIPSEQDTTVAGKPITSRVELIPLEDRYLLGGANSVRGYAQDGLDGQTRSSTATGGNAEEGGLAQLLVNVEIRVPLFWRLGAVCFLDAGNVWQDRQAITWERFVPHGSRRDVDSEDVRYSYGLGIRLGTPVGPFRIDYARKWNQPESNEEGRDRWHVAIGHAF